MRQCEKPSPNRRSSFFWKPNRGNRVFNFLNFEVGSVFRKPISEIFIGFRTPLVSGTQLTGSQMHAIKQQIRSIATANNTPQKFTAISTTIITNRDTGIDDNVCCIEWRQWQQKHLLQLQTVTTCTAATFSVERFRQICYKINGI